MKKKIFLLLSVFISFRLFATSPVVQDIQAIAGKGTRISVMWSLPKNPDEKITKLVLYRSNSPISSYKQIEKLTPIAELACDALSYTDTVSDYKDYFYACVAVTDKPSDLIMMSINSTSVGVHLQKPQNYDITIPEKTAKSYPEGSIREMPLPYIDVLEGMNEEALISDEVTDSVKEFYGKKTKKVTKLSPYIFEEDLVSPDGGDDFLLFEILKNTFIQKKYKDAITKLETLTGTNISLETRNRAYFYLGESQYLLGKYEEAIRTFVRVEEEFPDLTTRWIDSALDICILENN